MFDARHRLVLELSVEHFRTCSIPVPGTDMFWANWQLNGIFTAMSGTPFTVFDSNDVSLQGQAPEISGFSSNRPNVIGNPNSGPRTAAEWFNVSAFPADCPGPAVSRATVSATKVATSSKVRDT